MLAVPISGYAVEHQFSISRKMIVWPYNHLSPNIISDAVIYKATYQMPVVVELDIVDEDLYGQEDWL